MGILKHAIPRSVRGQMVEYVDDKLPDGFARRNLANTITISGALLVMAGAKMGGKKGLALRAIGEALDDVDGDTSRAFNIASRGGAILDPLLDKFKMLLELITLWRQSAELPDAERLERRLALGFIAGKHTVNAALNASSFLLGLEPHSSNMGKTNLWIDGVAIGAFGLSDVTQEPKLKEHFAAIGYAATLAGAPVGFITAAGYTIELIHGLQLKSPEQPT